MTLGGSHPPSDWDSPSVGCTAQGPFPKQALVGARQFGPTRNASLSAGLFNCCISHNPTLSHKGTQSGPKGPHLSFVRKDRVHALSRARVRQPLDDTLCKQAGVSPSDLSRPLTLTHKMHLIFHLPTVAERASPLRTWDSPWPNPPACLNSQAVRPHPKLRKQLDQPLIPYYLQKACTPRHHIPPVNPEPPMVHEPLEAIQFPLWHPLTGTGTQSLAMSRLAAPPRLSRHHSSVPPCTRLTGSAARPCRSNCHSVPRPAATRWMLSLSCAAQTPMAPPPLPCCSSLPLPT